MKYALNPMWIPHFEPSRLADNASFSLRKRIYDELAGRTLSTDQDSV